MDPLTIAIQNCSEQFIPLMKSDDVTVNIQSGATWYTVSIRKNPPSPTFPPENPVFVPARYPVLGQSVLGKRRYASVSPEPIEIKMHRCDDYGPLYNALYADFGHNFMPEEYVMPFEK